MKNFRDLQVWCKAHELTVAVYRRTAAFPREETFGLTRQIRRCSSSIGANIAEGCGRRGNGELHRFFQIAAGPVSALENHLVLARDLEFLRSEEYDQFIARVVELRKMLAGLIAKVDVERNAGYEIGKRTNVDAVP